MIHGVILTCARGTETFSDQSLLGNDMPPKFCRGTTAAAHSIQLSHWQLWVPFHVLNVRGTWLSLWRVLWRRFETFNQEVLQNKAQNCNMFIMSYKFYPFLLRFFIRLWPFPGPPASWYLHHSSVVSTPVHGRFPGLAVDSPRGLTPTRRLDQSPR